MGVSVSRVEVGHAILSTGSPEPLISTLPQGAFKYAIRAPIPVDNAVASTVLVTTTATSTSSFLSASSAAPCASIAQLAKGARRPPPIPAELAHDCLLSIPFQSQAAIAYLDSLRPYFEWQTTIEYAKNPPAEFAEKVQGPYDFRKNIERIYTSAKLAAYKSHYMFDLDLYNAVRLVHDNHFTVLPKSVASIFRFRRGLSLVSISLDGQSVPQTYVYEDILQTNSQGADFVPSPIIEINGRNSTSWLLDTSRQSELQDKDAAWNDLFVSLPKMSVDGNPGGLGAFYGIGPGGIAFPGQETMLNFSNGTSVTKTNYANILVSFTNITSGLDLYLRYLAPPSSGASRNNSSDASSDELLDESNDDDKAAFLTDATTSSSAPTGFPTNAVLRQRDNVISGYFLEGDGFDDIAVLSVPSFVGDGLGNAVLEFQQITTEFLDLSVAAGKKKLIVDVSGNGGGAASLPDDLFKQLFPQLQPYEAVRYRAHEALNLIGQEFSATAAQIPRTLNLSEQQVAVVASSFNYQFDLDINNMPFYSWAQKYGPHAWGLEPDNFTSLQRPNFSDPLYNQVNGDITVSGYLNRSNITVQPFAAESIVIITDVVCSSSCSAFVELMTQQGKVGVIAIGGRPNRDIIQTVGGTRGGVVNDLTTILQYAQTSINLAVTQGRSYYNESVLTEYNAVAAGISLVASINTQDQLRHCDETETPLQFIYDPADCRMYYTPEMISDISAVWRGAADIAFNGRAQCVAGTVAHASS